MTKKRAVKTKRRNPGVVTLGYNVGAELAKAVKYKYGESADVSLIAKAARMQTGTVSNRMGALERAAIKSGLTKSEVAAIADVTVGQPMPDFAQIVKKANPVGAGFVDASGIFHPVRKPDLKQYPGLRKSGYKYSKEKAGEGGKGSGKGGQKTKPASRPRKLKVKPIRPRTKKQAVLGRKVRRNPSGDLVPTRYSGIKRGDWYAGDLVVKVGPKYTKHGGLWVDIETTNPDNPSAANKKHAVLVAEKARRNPAGFKPSSRPLPGEHGYVPNQRDTVFPTRGEAEHYWYDSLPGRNDHAQFRKVKGGWRIYVREGFDYVPWNYSKRTANPVSPSRAGKSKWFLPYRRNRVNYEDVGYYPYLLQHDTGFGGTKIYRPVMHMTDGSFVLKGNYGMARKDALNWIKTGPGGGKTENPAKSQRTRRTTNPEPGADAMYQKFHGTAPSRTFEFTESIHEHSHLAALGTLHEIKIATMSGIIALEFERDRPILTSDENGRQLFITGGDQKIDIKSLGLTGKYWKELVLIGLITEITYETRKTMHNNRLTQYYHKLGEDTLDSLGSRSPHLFVHPCLLYDTVNQRLSIAGGTYKITARGIED